MSAAASHDSAADERRRVRPLGFRSPAGALEAMLFCREGERPSAAAVFCHPHPRYGGSMHNKVAYRASEAIFARGLPTLRFNFRGVGHSQGEWSGGAGEEEDAMAAVAFLGGLYPGRPVLLAGFSFGAGVALAVGAREPRVAALLAVAPPVAYRDLSFLGACPKPKGVVQGLADDVCKPGDLDAAFPGWSEPKAVRRVPAATHFFDGRLGELAAAVGELLEEPTMAAALGLAPEAR